LNQELSTIFHVKYLSIDPRDWNYQHNVHQLQVVWSHNYRILNRVTRLVVVRV
jgi:hypothetical protein